MRPYLSLATPLGEGKLSLRRLHGEESVSGLFTYALEMQSADPALDFSKIIGQSVTVTIGLDDGTRRYINGIVGRFVQSAHDANSSSYYAEIHPWLWLLTMSSGCRIWQKKNQTPLDVVNAVFSSLGFTEKVDFRDATNGKYDPVEYCVQYNETAFDFVSRLLQSIGVSYFFEHTSSGHTLVLADDASAYKECPGAKTVEVGRQGNWRLQNMLTSCEIEQNVIPSSFRAADFSFETPSASLLGFTSSTRASSGDRSLYEYPGGFARKDPADSVAKLRMEEREVPRAMLRGAGYCRAFFSGARTTVQGHYRTDVNATYILTRVAHDASEDGYENHFEAVPVDVPLRPARITPRPRIPGTQTAIVTGPNGDEIQTDKYGRVKVRFHWDLRSGVADDDTSCWVRVAQGWAGKSWGALFLPRIGQEVVVTFLDGDPDRPLITGAVYNAEQLVPLTLPDDKTKSTIRSNTSTGGGGFNEIRFNDAKGSEELFLQAQKDMNVTVKNDQTVSVGTSQQSGKGNQTVDVYNDRTVTVEQGNASLNVKTGNRTVTVGTGNETHTVAGTRDVTVTKAETHTSKADYTLKVEGDLVIDVTGKVTIKSGKDMTLQSKAGVTVTAAKDVSVSGQNITSKAKTALENDGASVTNKATGTLTNEGAKIVSNATGEHEVTATGEVTISGKLVKIN